MGQLLGLKEKWRKHPEARGGGRLFPVQLPFFRQQFIDEVRVKVVRELVDLKLRRVFAVALLLFEVWASSAEHGYT